MDSVSNPLDALRRVAIESRVIEDFHPVAACLEWRLSEAYWMSAGTQAFIEDSVPYASTSGGALAQDAAAVLVANCQDHPPQGPLVVLELCAGSGLFARAFVDAFRCLCERNGVRFHEQLVYYVTDRSPATLAQWKELGVLNGVGAIAAQGDARQPRFWQTDTGPVELSNIRAVFCNYGFDSLPAAIVRRGANGPEELCVRTKLTADVERLRRAGAPALDEVRSMAARSDTELLRLQSILELETAFLPCQANYPFLAESLERYGGAPRVVLNYGAMQSLSELVRMVEPGGFVLFSDYGLASANEPASHSSPQQFGESTAIGLHFPLLADFASGLGAELLTPETGATPSLQSRLLLRAECPHTRATFAKLFGAMEWRTLRDRAQAHVLAGAVEDAKAAYETVLGLYEKDWSILGEVAEFVIRKAGDCQAGLVMANAALGLNPWYSTWLWNVYGDAHYGLQRFDEALAIYKIAEGLAPRDVRTQVNLSYAQTALGDFEAALLAIAKGLANDYAGEYRERLKEKQQQILATLRSRRVEAEQSSERRRQRLQAG